jgi:hypothetical protein
VKKTVILLVVCLTSTLVAAQDAGSRSERSNSIGQQGAKTTHSSTATRLQVRGCIVAGARGYTLLQSTGTTFGLQGDPMLFDSCQGRFVEVTANEGAPANTSENLPQLHVSKLRILADKCPIEAGNVHNQLGPANPGAPAGAETPRYPNPGANNQAPPKEGNNPTQWGNGSGAPSPGTGNQPKQPPAPTPQ